MRGVFRIGIRSDGIMNMHEDGKEMAKQLSWPYSPLIDD
jgi:hypothetical protein